VGKIEELWSIKKNEGKIMKPNKMKRKIEDN
jgi:hypothetical protein